MEVGRTDRGLDIGLVYSTWKCIHRPSLQADKGDDFQGRLFAQIGGIIWAAVPRKCHR